MSNGQKKLVFREPYLSPPSGICHEWMRYMFPI